MPQNDATLPEAWLLGLLVWLLLWHDSHFGHRIHHSSGDSKNALGKLSR